LPLLALAKEHCATRENLAVTFPSAERWGGFTDRNSYDNNN